MEVIKTDYEGSSQGSKLFYNLIVQGNNYGNNLKCDASCEEFLWIIAWISQNSRLSWYTIVSYIVELKLSNDFNVIVCSLSIKVLREYMYTKWVH